MASCKDILQQMRALPDPGSFLQEALNLQNEAKSATDVATLQEIQNKAKAARENDPRRVSFWNSWKSLSSQAEASGCVITATEDAKRIAWLQAGNEYGTAQNITIRRIQELTPKTPATAPESVAAEPTPAPATQPAADLSGLEEAPPINAEYKNPYGATTSCSTAQQEIRILNENAEDHQKSFDSAKDGADKYELSKDIIANIQQEISDGNYLKDAINKGIRAAQRNGNTAEASCLQNQLSEVNTALDKLLAQQQVVQSIIDEAGLEEVAVTATEIDTANAVGALNETRSQPPARQAIPWAEINDWRIRLALSPNSKCLYNDPDIAKDPNSILYPLVETKGIIFPYVPQITMSYSAQYNPIDVTHSNYKIFTYQSSSVDEFNIQADFTAQDTKEANYLIAVIHFFRAVTKMFYGQDQNPKPGTPPPLCYIFGMGQWQFNAQPLVITNFSYSLPNAVDYIRAGKIPNAPGVNTENTKTKTPNTNSSAGDSRASALPVAEGGTPKPTRWNTSAMQEVTYVPTKINLQIRALPVVSRNDVSNSFSLKKYADGHLLNRKNNYGTGFW